VSSAKTLEFKFLWGPEYSGKDYNYIATLEKHNDKLVYKVDEKMTLPSPCFRNLVPTLDFDSESVILTIKSPLDICKEIRFIFKKDEADGVAYIFLKNKWVPFNDIKNITVIKPKVISEFHEELYAKKIPLDTQNSLNQVRLKEEAQAKVQDESRLKNETLAAAKSKEEARLKAESLALAKSQDEARLKAEAQVKTQQENLIKQSAVNEAALKEALQKIADLTEQNKALSKPIVITDNVVKRKALLIGNDKYQFVTPLKNAKADATSMGKALNAVGYKVWVKTDLNRKDLQATIRQFKSDVEPGDEVVIFYAGHGIQIGSTNYLLPTDIVGSSEEEVKDDSIQLQRLLDDMSDKKVLLTLVVIDACRDNPFPKAGRAIGGRGLAPTAAASGQMIIFSAGVGQQALDRLGENDKDPNGLFTRMFIHEMKTAGVRIDNVVREVRKKVVDAAKAVGHEQVPAIYDQVVGDFYFIK
jgi:uncharacterized caspase-like protein